MRVVSASFVENLRLAVIFGLALAITAVSASCERRSDDGSEKGSGESNAEAQPQRDLTAELNGEALDIQKAVAIPIDDGYELYLGTVPRTCSYHHEQWQPLNSDEVSFNFTVARQLEKDGSAGWHVAKTYFRGQTDMGRVDDAEVDAPEVDGGRVRLNVSAEIPGMEPRDGDSGPRPVIALEGAIDAKLCGPPPPPEGVEPLEGVSADVHGTTFDIRGAVFETRFDDRELELSSRPRGCDSQRAGAFVLGIPLPEDAEGEVEFDVGMQFTMRGFAFPRQMTEPVREGASMPEVTVDGQHVSLDGSIEVMGYPVELSGELDAIDCTRER